MDTTNGNGQFEIDSLNTEIIIVKDSDCEIDTTVKPIPDNLRWIAEQYLEKMKKYEPEEYDRMMRQAEVPGKQNPQ